MFEYFECELMITNCEWRVFTSEIRAANVNSGGGGGSLRFISGPVKIIPWINTHAHTRIQHT